MASKPLEKEADIKSLLLFARKIKVTPQNRNKKKALIELLDIELSNCKANERSAIIRLTPEKKAAWKVFDKKYKPAKK